MNGLIRLQRMKKITASMGVKQVDLICSQSLGKFHPQEDGYCRWYIDIKIQLVCGLIYVL